jgi:hypothetical protein
VPFCLSTQHAPCINHQICVLTTPSNIHDSHFRNTGKKKRSDLHTHFHMHTINKFSFFMSGIQVECNMTIAQAVRLVSTSEGNMIWYSTEMTDGYVPWTGSEREGA